MHYIYPFSFGLLLTLAAPMGAQQEPPESWVDPDTGHRIVRLTDEPGSASLYFNQNGYTADGRKMVFTTANGISVLDLTTHAARPVVQGQLFDGSRYLGHAPNCGTPSARFSLVGECG